jgi:hypothetical protein
MSNESNWIDADGNRINYSQLVEWIKSSKNDLISDSELIIGTDSHLHRYFYRFVTVVCIYKKGRGGNYYYTVSEQHKKEFKGNYPVRVKARMFHEAGLTIEFANEIQEKTGITPVVHLDASPPESGELTSMFSDQLKGYVTACGFECYIKPWSFAASSVANKHSK